MKQIGSFLLLLLLASTLITCQEITPLTPPNPVPGKWTLYSFEIYHLPAWFVTKTKTEYKITPTDTIYGNASLPALFNVHSFTFNQDQTFSELYPIPYLKAGEPGGKVDKGNWTLADSVVSLSVPNNFPNKLNYSFSTDKLYTEKFPQTVDIKLGDESIYTVSYTIRLYYRRGDP